MISVEDAKRLVSRHSKTLPATNTPIELAVGKVISAGISSPVNLPPFHQSAMDGYAFRFLDFQKKISLNIVAEVAAGYTHTEKLKKGQAVRIFTGASLPEGADTVVIQERAKTNGRQLIIEDIEIQKGANVRQLGSQVKKGQTALPKNTLINPGGVGYLAAMGIASIQTISTPKISVIITGSELVPPGAALGNGQIYESNSYTLKAAMHSIGLQAFKIYSVQDNLQLTLKTIQRAIAQSDMVLITGGISVGEYDYVGKALHQLGVKNIFYKINQKPGKPLFFGKKDETILFGLPGNPAAVLSCFYEYVFPAINKMMGKKDLFLKKLSLPISINYPKKAGLALFLKGRITNESVLPFEGQESYILSSFSQADCIIYLHADRKNLKVGEMVEVHLLPGLY